MLLYCFTELEGISIGNDNYLKWAYRITSVFFFCTIISIGTWHFFAKPSFRENIHVWSRDSTTARYWGSFRPVSQNTVYSSPRTRYMANVRRSVL